MKKICFLLLFVALYAVQSRAQSCICISGPNTTCDNGTAGTFSVTSGSAASYTWSVTSNLQIISGQGTSSVQVASSGPYASGYGTVTVQLGDVSCGVSLSYQTLLIGPPSNTFTVQQNSSPFCTNSFGNWMTIVQQSLPNVDYFEWGFSELNSSTYPTVVNAHGNYDQAFNNAFPHAGLFEIYAREGSNCGGLGNTFTCIVEVDDNCGGGGFGSGFAIHPNPANDIVSISAPGSTQTNKVNATGSTASTPFSYKVYDLAGKLVKSGKSDGGDVSIDTHNLPAQMYVVNIFVGNQVIKKMMIVQHK